MRRSHASPASLMCAVFAFAAATTSPAVAQEAPDALPPDPAAPRPLRDLTTDRPDVTESPFTVDAGHIQIETTLLGYARSRRDAAGVVTETYEFATTNLRIGMTDNVELGIVWQPHGIVDPRGDAPTQRGIGSVTLRAKVNLWGNDGPALAGGTALGLLPYVTLPTDRDNRIGNTETGFGLLVPLAIELGGGFALGVNAGADFSREDGQRGHDATGLASASLARDWGGGLGSYAEVAWAFGQRGAGAVVTLNTGFTYALGENWQADAGVNIGASRAADAIAPFIGITARF